jgi:hypothetical protein
MYYKSALNHKVGGISYLANVSTIDVLPQCISIKGFALAIISWESVLGVRDEESAITGTLESTKDSASGRGFSQTNVKEYFEWSSSILSLFSKSVAAIRLSDTLIFVCKTDLCQCSTSNEKACGICGGPILETVGDSVFGQLRGVSRSENNISLELGVDNLANLEISSFNEGDIPLWCL